MSRQRPFLAALFLALPATLSAADGDLDTAFSTDGKYVSNWGVASEATAVAGLDDGSLLVGGWVKLTSNSPSRLAVLKLLPNGALDPGFAAGGRFEREVAIGDSSQAEVLDIYPLADGRILLAAWASRDFQRDTVVTVRLLENGSPDLTYGPNGLRVVEESPVDTGWPILDRSALAPNGGLVLAGHCFGCDAASTFVLRLEADGEIDRDFGDEGWALFDAESGIDTQSIVVAVDPEGRPVVAGNVSGGGGAHELFVARLTTLGGFDLSFGGGDGLAFVDFATYAWPTGLAIDSVTGRLLIAAGSPFLAPDAAGILALDTGGELITDFGFLGVTSLTLEEGSHVESIALQSDGKIVAAGAIDHTGAASTGFFLARLLPTGQLDDSFDGNGVVRYEFDREGDAADAAEAVALVGGKLVAAGYGDDVGEFPLPAMAVLRTQSALVFSDGFERGSASAWLGN